LSETPTPEPLKPDTEEEIAELRRLEASDAIIKSRDQEISNLKSSLVSRDEIIAEATEQIARLESEIASEKSAMTVPASDFSAKTKAICELVKPLVSAKYVKDLNAQIEKEMERK